jgi:hypothetical protein
MISDKVEIVFQANISNNNCLALWIICACISPLVVHRPQLVLRLIYASPQILVSIICYIFYHSYHMTNLISNFILVIK